MLGMCFPSSLLTTINHKWNKSFVFLCKETTKHWMNSPDKWNERIKLRKNSVIFAQTIARRYVRNNFQLRIPSQKPELNSGVVCNLIKNWCISICAKHILCTLCVVCETKKAEICFYNGQILRNIPLKRKITTWTRKWNKRKRNKC